MNKIGEAELKLLKEIYGENIDDALQKIKNNYPIQYLIGYVDFYDSVINVNENVLIPRYETELLVDFFLKEFKDKNYKNLIDICTGSGCIAISIKKNMNLEVDACDISKEALDVARENAINNKVSINFFEKDILKEELSKKYDCIISNPPYVKEDEEVSLETKYEPQIALFGKDNGLEFYKRILGLAKKYLNESGIIAFEIGATLGDDIKKIALENFPKAKITILKDFNNYDRFFFLENIV